LSWQADATSKCIPRTISLTSSYQLWKTLHPAELHCSGTIQSLSKYRNQSILKTPPNFHKHCKSNCTDGHTNSHSPRYLPFQSMVVIQYYYWGNKNSPDTKTKPLSLPNCLTNLPQWRVPGKRRGKPHAEVSQHCEKQQKQERRGSPCPLPSAPCNQSCLPADASNPLRFPHHCPPPPPPSHLHCYVAAPPPPPCRIPQGIYKQAEEGSEKREMVGKQGSKQNKRRSRAKAWSSKP